MHNALQKIVTLISIILNQVARGSVIWIDETPCYASLSKHGYQHVTVCHKREFITSDGVDPQCVKSFNNILKPEIKTRKGIKTENEVRF